MSDMDLLNEMPCYPFTCVALNDLRGGDGEQGKSIVFIKMFLFFLD